MRKAVIICMVFGFSAFAKAQTAASPGRWEENNGNARTARTQDANEFMNTEMSVDNGRISFSDLPGVKKATWALITDPQGEVITQKRVTPESNTMDIHRLPKGEMYFVTLLYKNKSKKGFVLHL